MLSKGSYAIIRTFRECRIKGEIFMKIEGTTYRGKIIDIVEDTIKIKCEDEVHIVNIENISSIDEIDSISYKISNNKIEKCFDEFEDARDYLFEARKEIPHTTIDKIVTIDDSNYITFRLIV